MVFCYYAHSADIDLWTRLWGRYHVPQNVFLVCYEADLPFIFVESLAAINPGTLVETSWTTQTYLHVTHFRKLKISGVTGPKFKNFFQDVEGLSWSRLWTDVLRSFQPFKGRECQLVAISRHKIGCRSNVLWPKLTKFLALGIFYRRYHRSNTRCDPSTRCRTRGRH